MRDYELSELAVVIPSRNRQKFLLRSITFWSKTNAVIYIVDGSKKAISTKKILNFSENIKYYHSRKNLSERMTFIASIIKEPFSCLVGDDEFLIPSSLKSCINYLKKNEDYVSCIGRSVAFGFNKKTKKIMGCLSYPEMESLNLSQKEPSERLKYHFKNYTPSQIFSVCKSKEWKIGMESLRVEFGFFAQMEMQFELTLSYSGKSLVIPELMLLRSLENDIIIDTEPGLTSGVGLDKFWRNKNFSIEKEKFLFHMIEILKKVSTQNHKKIKKDIVDGIVCFCEFHDEHLIRTKQIPKKRIFDPLKKLLPIKFKNFIKKLIRLEKVKGLNLSLDKTLDDLSKSSVRINREELDEIVLMIRKFHEG